MVEPAIDEASGVPAALGLQPEVGRSGSRRRTVVIIATMLGYQGYTMTINSTGAPWIATSFALTQSGIAGMYTWIAFSALGALVLARFADKVGRRRVLFWCMLATPVCALGASQAAGPVMYVLFELPLYACIGATVSGAVVMLAEELPIEKRAMGQSVAGLSLGLGAGICLLVTPLLIDNGYSWRWLLGISAAGLVGLPFVARAMPESRRWQNAAGSGNVERSRLRDLFKVPYRRRAVPLLAAATLSQTAAAAAMSWSYFHAVSVVGLSPGVASAFHIIGGGLGLVGYILGARSCERVGRVRTVVMFGLFVTGGALWFYWGPPQGFAHPALWLGFGFGWMTMAGNGAMVGANSAATELFPTALRVTVFGAIVLMHAVAGVTAQGLISLLAEPLGGLSVVVGYLAMLAVPGALTFGVFIDETRGLSLEAAAGE